MVAELRAHLFKAMNIIYAIKSGSVDVCVLDKNGRPVIYVIESADYTYRLLIEKHGKGTFRISEQGLMMYCNNYFLQLVIMCNKIIGTEVTHT